MNARLIRWALRARGTMLALVLLSLLVTLTYAGQGLLIATVVRRILTGGSVGDTVPALAGFAALQLVRVAAIWGVDGQETSRRTNLPDRGYITEKAIDSLLRQPFDVLLCHDAPYSAKRTGFGSKLLAMLIELSRPSFCFFGHYKGEGGPSLVSFAPTGVFHMAGFEMRGRGQTTEVGSVGVLRWTDGRGYRRSEGE